MPDTQAVQLTATQQLAALQARIDERDKELAEAKANVARLETERKREGTLSFKVGEKGGMSMYGLGRFPVTLYKSQWLRLVEAVKNGTVEKRITDFGTALKEKADGKVE